MSKVKDLVFNTAIIGIGNFGTKILSFLLVPLYTSILSASDYGRYDLVVTIVAFCIPFVTCLMEESMFRFLIDCKDDSERKNVITQSLAIICFGCFLFLAAFFFVCCLFDFEYKIFFALLVVSDVATAVRNAYYRGTGQIKRYALINFISSALLIASNILLIAVAKIGIVGLFLSQILIGVLSLIIIIPIIRNYVSLKKINAKQVRRMMKYSIPLIPNSICWSVINTSDRLIISGRLGSGANGVYSIANKFPNAVDTFYSFFYIAWKESSARAQNDEDREVFYNTVFQNLKRILFTAIVGIIGLLPFIFGLLVKNDFTESYIYIPVLIVSIYCANISGFYGGIFSAKKNTKIMGITTIVAACLNLAIDFALIGTIGIWAAAISTLVSTFLMCVWRKIAVRKYVCLKENYLERLIEIVILGGVIAAYYSGLLYAQIIAIVVAGAYCIVINRGFIKLIFRKVAKLGKR